ncbi:MAG: NAD(P)-dependent alcohol dehydrogenase [Planctomycetota bacterium]
MHVERWQFDQFGLEHLRWTEGDIEEPGPDEVQVEVKAASPNYRDVLVIRGSYNPKLKLPAVPLCDGAGVLRTVGRNVKEFRRGDAVLTNFFTGWTDQPFDASMIKTVLGGPGPGLAATFVNLPATGVMAKPAHLTFPEAAALPVAGLTAWSALVTEGRLDPDKPNGAAGKTVLAIGTGGVSMYVLQFAKAMGARVIITSSSDEKLARAKAMGADEGINYRTTPEWDAEVLELTDRKGADIVVDSGGSDTLPRCLRACRGGGMIAVLGALTGLDATLNTGLIMMKRLRLQGIVVDSRRAHQRMLAFLSAHPEIKPLIDRTFALQELPAALDYLLQAKHMGKIVLTPE